MPFATKTQFQIGTYNALTDTFTLVLDLNDGTTFQILDGSPDIQAPARDIDRASNPRYAGEVIVRERYKNGNIQVGFSIRGANVAAITASMRSFMAAVDNPPYVIAYALPGATNVSYFDVVACTHSIELLPKKALANVLKGKALFECKPYLRGPRQTLQNLVMNPGFEAPNGVGIRVFNDSFANANPYTAGTATGGVLTIPVSTLCQFGSPSWGAFNQWAIRFQFNTGLIGNFYFHYVDGNNKLFAVVTSTSITLNHTIAGVNTQLATASFAALTNGTFYWLLSTQFPALSGDTPFVQTGILNDSGGAIGTSIQSLGPVATASATIALVGRPGFLSSGVAFNLGGFSPSHSLSLFGPGGWVNSSAGTGTASGAWDGTRVDLGMSGTGVAGTNTYPGGPVTSFGSLRVDAAPAGTLNTAWITYAGGAPAGVVTVIPTAQNHVLGVSAWLKSAGVGAGCSQAFNIVEYNSAGTFLVGNTVVSKTGAQGTWTQLAGNYTVQQATCAYVAVQLAVADTTSGSVNGTIWFDNIQCWDQTTTGMATMPYCELRFPQSPAQLLVSGILGDAPTSAWTALGTFYATPTSTTAFTFALGRKAALVPNVKLVVPTDGQSPSFVPILDSTSYGGCYMLQPANATGVDVLDILASDSSGVYHLFARIYTTETVGNLPNISASVRIQTESTSPNTTTFAGVITPSVSPLSASAVWGPYDMGQIVLPSLPVGALGDPTHIISQVLSNWLDTTAGAPSIKLNWHCFLPVDAEIVTGKLVLGTTFTAGFANSYWFVYADGASVSAGIDTAWTWSIASAPMPNQAYAAGTAFTSTINTYPALPVNASPYMTLDPTVTNGAGLSVNQFGGYMTDQLGAVQPMIVEMQYSPLYFYPR